MSYNSYLSQFKKLGSLDIEKLQKKAQRYWWMSGMNKTMRTALENAYKKWQLSKSQVITLAKLWRKNVIDRYNNYIKSKKSTSRTSSSSRTTRPSSYTKPSSYTRSSTSKTSYSYTKPSSSSRSYSTSTRSYSTRSRSSYVKPTSYTSTPKQVDDTSLYKKYVDAITKLWKADINELKTSLEQYWWVEKSYETFNKKINRLYNEWKLSKDSMVALQTLWKNYVTNRLINNQQKENKVEQPYQQKENKVEQAYQPQKVDSKPLSQFKNEYEGNIKELEQKMTDAIETYKSQLWDDSQVITWLENTTKLLQSQLQNVYDIVNAKNKIYDATFDTLRSSLTQLSDKYWTTYSNISSRINKYEEEMQSTFKRMQANLNKIWETYKKVLEFNQAASWSAAEKQLRWVTGKWWQLRVANYMQQMNQKATKDMAELQTKLLQQKNNLETALLEAKKLIMNDENLTDKEKMSILDNINSRLDTLTRWFANFKMGQIDELNKPVKAYLDTKMGTLMNLELRQLIEKLDYKWKSEPENRDVVISTTIERLWLWKVPSSVIETMKKAPDYLSALKILNDYLRRINDRKSVSTLEKLVSLYNKR